MSDRMPVTVLNQHSAHKAEAKAQGVLDLATVVGCTKTSPTKTAQLLFVENWTPSIQSIVLQANQSNREMVWAP